MTRFTQELLDLAEVMGGHSNVSHWTISRRATRKGDFFDRLKSKRDIQTGTYLDVLGWFDANWPEDLEWPRGIERPSLKQGAA